jgi:hypothetical protein
LALFAGTLYLTYRMKLFWVPGHGDGNEKPAELMRQGSGLKFKFTLDIGPKYLGAGNPSNGLKNHTPYDQIYTASV